MSLSASLSAEIDRIAVETGFSGVVTISRSGNRFMQAAYGYANRAHRVANTLDTRFGIASGSKGLTALGIGWLLHNGDLTLETTVRDVLGDALPLVDPAVTVRHLLGHTSGIGDYVDEETFSDKNDYVLDAPVHRLTCPADFVPILSGYPQKTPPGSTFAYNNGGYVLLSLIVEAASGESFYDLIRDRVLAPAGMSHTDFPRSDELPGSAAVGYLLEDESLRSNILHLPVRAVGDGGAYSTVADVETLWTSLFGGRILPLDLVETFVTAHSSAPAEGLDYGYGFWLRPDRPTVMAEGSDAGVSFRSAYDRPSTLTYVVISNTSSGAWPLVRYLDAQLPALADTPP
jgi:CubicO group peptidase (beta-lactamase class C family)